MTTDAPTSGVPAPTVPTSVARAVLLSAGGQLLGKVLLVGLNIVSSLIVIRHLAPAAYGEFVLVVTVVATVGLLADLGLTRIAVRRVAADPTCELSVLGVVVTVRVVLSAVAAGLTQLVLLALGSGPQVRLAALVLSAMLFAEAALSIVVVFHVRLEQQYEALVRVVIEIVETVVLVVLVRRSASLVALMTAPVAGAAVGVALAVVLVRRRVALPRPRRAGAGALLQESLPVAGSLMLTALYLKLGLVVLAAYGASGDVGLYGAASAPVEYLLLSFAVVANVLLPLLVRARAGDPIVFDALYRRATELICITVLPVAVGLAVLAPRLTRTLYGPGYEAAGTLLAVQAAALPMLVLGFWQAIVLLAGHRQRDTFAYDAAAVVVQVALCLLLVPRLGPAGPAWALLVTSGLVLVVATRVVTVRLEARLERRRLAGVAAAAAAAGVALAALWPVGPSPAIVLAVVVYGTVLHVVGLTRRSPYLQALVPVGLVR